MGIGFLWKFYLSKSKPSVYLWFILGGVIPLLITGFYLWYFNIVQDFLNSYLINSLHYGNATGAMTNSFSKVEYLYKIDDYLTSIKEYKYLLFSALVSSVLGIVVFIKAIYNKNAKNRYDFFFFALLFLTAFFCVVKPKTFATHYQNMLIAPALFIAAYALAYIEKSSSKAQFKTLIQVFIVFNVLIASVLSINTTHWQYYKRFNTVSPISEVLRNVKTMTTPNEKVAVWGWNTYFYLEAGLLQGTRDGHTHYQMIPIRLRLYFLNRYKTDLERNKPRLIIETFDGGLASIFGNNPRPKYGLQNYPLLWHYIQQNYLLNIDIEGHTRIFVRK